MQAASEADTTGRGSAAVPAATSFGGNGSRGFNTTTSQTHRTPLEKSATSGPRAWQRWQGRPFAAPSAAAQTAHTTAGERAALRCGPGKARLQQARDLRTLAAEEPFGAPSSSSSSAAKLLLPERAERGPSSILGEGAPRVEGGGAAVRAVRSWGVTPEF